MAAAAAMLAMTTARARALAMRAMVQELAAAARRGPRHTSAGAWLWLLTHLAEHGYMGRCKETAGQRWRQ